MPGTRIPVIRDRDLSTLFPHIDRARAASEAVKAQHRALGAASKKLRDAAWKTNPTRRLEDQIPLGGLKMRERAERRKLPAAEKAAMQAAALVAHNVKVRFLPPGQVPPGGVDQGRMIWSIVDRSPDLRAGGQVKWVLVPKAGLKKISPQYRPHPADVQSKHKARIDRAERRLAGQTFERDGVAFRAVSMGQRISLLTVGGAARPAWLPEYVDVPQHVSNPDRLPAMAERFERKIDQILAGAREVA